MSLDSAEWKRQPLDEQREWLSGVVERVGVAKSQRLTYGPSVDLDRLTVHFKDGQDVGLSRPRVTMSDVAELVGCTRDNASRALHGQGRFSQATLERVRAAAVQLGYDLPT